MVMRKRAETTYLMAGARTGRWTAHSSPNPTPLVTGIISENMISTKHTEPVRKLSIKYVMIEINMTPYVYLRNDQILLPVI